MALGLPLIFLQIVGSLCVVFSRFTWFGAGELAALTVVAMFVANDFWDLEGVAGSIVLNSFFEHLGLIVAFIMVRYLASGERRTRV